jgi:hypothetical protein
MTHCRTKVATFAVALMLVTTQCHHAKSGPPQGTVPPQAQTQPAPPPASNPVCQVDPTQIPSLVDQQMSFVNLGALPSSPPHDGLGGFGPPLDQYKSWLSTVAQAISAGQDPLGTPGYRTLYYNAYKELVAIGAMRSVCQGNSGTVLGGFTQPPRCKDVDSQQWELQGGALSSAGSQLFITFSGDCSANRAAAANYLIEHYGVPATQ